jgi:acetyl-CoA carboxylase carboxyltransferase component
MNIAAALRAPLAGTLIEQTAAAGVAVREGELLGVIEAMKMEHELRAPCAGIVGAWQAHVGEAVIEQQLLLNIEQQSEPARWASAEKPQEIAAVDRSALQAWQQRQALVNDDARPEAMLKRHAAFGGSRSARENLADLLDEDSFTEYGALAIAAQATRRSLEDLRSQTPADGMVCGTGLIGGIKVAAFAYDATVLAGTQGMRNHQKTDRVLDMALREQLPCVIFAEGGGGRPGDVDMPIVAGLHVSTFARFAALRTVAPIVAVVHGRCFAGNAALAGMASVLIATTSANIGMGGPAMIEGGGLGSFAPQQIGPANVQHANGVIDVLCPNEAEATDAAKAVLGMLAGRTQTAFTGPQASVLASLVPTDRRRAYDARTAAEHIVDRGSITWLGTGWGHSIQTALARLGGKPVGFLVSNPLHLGGALDAASCRKATRFMQLLSAHDLPMISLIDTPGFMVGPDAEEQAQVRAAGDWFVAAAQHRARKVAIVLRKAYGLGAMAFAGGSLHAPAYTCAWPTAEFGAMGLEGAVRLGFKKELASTPEGAQRDALFAKLLADLVAKGAAVPMAETLEIDAVMDPVQTRAALLKLTAI